MRLNAKEKEPYGSLQRRAGRGCSGLFDPVEILRQGRLASASPPLPGREQEEMSLKDSMWNRK